MSSSKNRDAERRAEQAFKIQAEHLETQKEFLQQQNALAEQVVRSVEATQAAQSPAREQALANLQRALGGEERPELKAFIEDAENRGAASIRRNFGPGGESSTGAIAMRKALEGMKAESISAASQGDIAAAIGATNSLEGMSDTQIGRLLEAGILPLKGSTALGQGAVNLGTLSRFTPRDTRLADFGSATISGLASQPNAVNNIRNNISGGLSFLASPFRNTASQPSNINAGVLQGLLNFNNPNRSRSAFYP